MEIRHTTYEDLPRLLRLYEDARQFMRSHGNLSQWSGGYPPEALLRRDIEEGCGYICTQGEDIAAAFYFRLGIDPTYERIEKGQWPDEEPYGVIHRIASSGHIKGAASFCVSWCAARCQNLRIDTHEDNYVMQNFLKKNGFAYCGIIYTDDGTPRLAYHKKCASSSGMDSCR